jgi:fucose 4-O-acetylase-like acetyltransferase
MNQDSETAEKNPSSASHAVTRLHDLDALRAMAMLIGISYHIALSLAAGMPWLVQDQNQSSIYYYFQSWVHGFRMPLFFLVSGFFTAMLWRKRGARALVKHRFKRIFIPCMLGLVTIIPLTNWSIGKAMSTATPPPENGSDNSVQAESANDLWAAIGSGNISQLKALIESGNEINEVHPMFGSSPLSFACLIGANSMVELLLEAGADINIQNKDGGTPLHSAAFFGQASTVKLLLENGANKDITDNTGSSAVNAAQVDWQTTQFIAGMVQIPVDRKTVESGRRKVLVLLDPEKFSTNGSGSNGSQGSSEIGAWILWLFFAPIFGHLWFLWFLCWFVGVFVVYAKIANWLGWKSGPRRWLVSPWRYFWLIPATMIPQAFMGIVTPGFGPDTSLGILPQPHVFVYYLIFFGFGALYFDCEDPNGKVGRGWKWVLPVSLLIVFPMALEIYSGIFGVREKLNLGDLKRPLEVGLMATFAWMSIFAMLGAFKALFGSHNNTMRYISDASYWMYIIHLPLVILAQMWVRFLDVSPHLKFLIMNVGVIGFTLVTYHFLVRYTWIGTLLNGKRTR